MKRIIALLLVLVMAMSLFAGCDLSGNKPTEPAPTEPTPTEPAPTEPAPTEPAPTEPAPTEKPTETPTDPPVDDVPPKTGDTAGAAATVMVIVALCLLAMPKFKKFM